MPTKVKCLWCGDILESDTIHNMIWCKCGKTGFDYHPVWPRITFTSNSKGEGMYEVIE